MFMHFKRLKERTEITTSWVLTWLLKIFVKSMPETLLYRFGHVLGSVCFHVASKRRKRTIINLTYAYQDEKSSEEIIRLAERVFHEIAETAVDTAIHLFKEADLHKGLSQGISVEGTQYLDEALKTKKGVICIGTHIGNFLLLARMLSLMGYPCKDVVKDADNPISAEIWRILRRRAGVQWIPVSPKIKAISDSLKWLKEGGILFLYADQHKRDGVSVKFLNYQTVTVEGPALMHLRTGAEILCAVMIRLGRRKHKIIITPPITVEKSGNRKEDVYHVTQAYTEVIEAFVRRYPEQWCWPWRKRLKRN